MMNEALAREHFDPGELAVVLSHYDLGVIQSAKEFPRGSRHSPKLLLRTASGRYLLKRRAQGRDLPERVGFAHALLRHLRARRFPVPELLSTRDGHTSILQYEGRIYELFEFVPGERYDGSLDQTLHAGRTLARFHQVVADFDTPWQPAPGTFHNASAIRTALNAIPAVASSHDEPPGQEADLAAIVQELHEHYDRAVRTVEDCGFAQWPITTVHCDWHPGNMLFRGHKVAVVLDFDSARLQPKGVDVANGMLQFSMLRGDAEPQRWPDYFDETRMRRFLIGYFTLGDLPPEQRRALPGLMIQSLIAESVLPIALTGSLGPLPGLGVLQMVLRKIRWLGENAEQLQTWIRD